MSTFIERLQSEKDELNSKISKLASFIDGDFMGQDISETQARLLNDQLNAMSVYSNCLEERLLDLKQ